MAPQRSNFKALLRAALLGAALLLAAGGPSLVRAAPCTAVLTAGSTTLKGTWTFNFDQALSGLPLSTSDLWWDMMTSTTRQLVPLNGAQLAILPAGTDFNLVTPDTLAAQAYSSASIDGSDGTSKLLPGTVVAFRTYTGHYGKLLVQGIDLSLNHGLVMTWADYKNCTCVPTIYSSGGTTLKGTWTFNLDTGVQGGASSTSDLWWEMMTSTARQLVPLNGAQLAIMPTGTVFSQVTRATLQAQPYSTAPIDGSDGTSKLLPGTVVAYRTFTGHFGKMLVRGIDLAQNHGLVMQWVTFSDRCACVCS